MTKLKQAFSASGLSQSDTARSLGISRSNICKMLVDPGRVPPAQIQRVAKMIGMDHDIAMDEWAYYRHIRILQEGDREPRWFNSPDVPPSLTDLITNGQYSMKTIAEHSGISMAACRRAIRDMNGSNVRSVVHVYAVFGVNEMCARRAYWKYIC